mmetsp:Transcript_28045/g.94207  ORF Transcript_28045/g.94207 Transcript_28045/m.94207 type:complete len:913 (+) Transcript_28045:106-2844(+)
MALSILLAAVTDLEGCVRKEDVPFISVTRNDLGLSQQRCDTNFCWKKVTSPVPALPAGTPHLAYETDVDQLCTSETDAGVIIVGAPASLQPDDQFSSISMQVRRNCDLFARMLVGRGGLRINATQVAGVKCVFLGDGSSQLQVTNATSRLLHSEAGGFASADFLLGPYGSGLTSYASKQAVADGTVMVAPAASDHAVYSSAAALAQEDGLQPLVFGLLSGSENWARRGFEAVLKAAEDCDTGCEQGKSCSCRDECGERARARTCLTSLRVGYVQEENAFRGTVCSSAQREWGDAKARILTAPAAAAGTGVVANATVPKWGSVDGEEYRREMRRALAHLRGEGATVVLVCSYEAGGIVAVEELERLGLEEEEDFSPLATILTTTVINDEYARKMRGGWWQGEYALQAVPWDASMPSDVGHFSGWNSSTYAEEFMSAFGGHAEYPAKVDYVGAATFAALCTLGAAIERAGSLETAAVASALRSTSLVEFFTSNISFNADGQMEGMDFPVVQYPPGAASAGQAGYEVVFDAKDKENVSFPTPPWKLRHCLNEGNCSGGNGKCRVDGGCDCLARFSGARCQDVPKDVNVTALAVGLASGLFFSTCLVGLWLRRRRRQLEVVIADFRKEADLQAEARQALADAALEMSGAQCTFVFIKADVIRSGLYEAAGYSTLPRLQEIEAKHPEWVCKRLLRRHLAYGRHEYRDNILAVSHRWEQPDAPDASSIHVRAVREHLQACPSIECVWYDYWCMPQGEDKTPLEKVDFKRMLMNVNLLYLGSSVLILQELSYMSRFWTQFEAWCSMQEACDEGLRPAPAERRRCVVVPIHLATEALAVELVRMWAGRSVDEAIETLASPDVTVTNQSDKELQLYKLRELDSLVREAIACSFRASVEVSEIRTSDRASRDSREQILRLGF